MDQVEEQKEKRELLAFRNFTRGIAHSADFSILLKAILESLHDIFEQSDAIVLFLHRQVPNQLVAECAIGYDMDPAYRIKLQVDEGIAGEVFSSGQARLYATPEAVAEAMADMSTQNRAYLSQAMLDCDCPKSVLAFPLFSGNETMGVVMLVGPERKLHHVA
nr:GAF domain-containing protein [Chloroflexota bacterium]